MIGADLAGGTVVGALFAAISGLAIFARWLIERSLTGADDELTRLRKADVRQDRLIVDLHTQIADLRVLNGVQAEQLARLRSELAATHSPSQPDQEVTE